MEASIVFGLEQIVTSSEVKLKKKKKSEKCKLS